MDDEKLLRWSLGKTLGKAGYKILEAGTVDEGKAAIMGEEPEICLLDINLPDGNGLGLLKWAKNSNVDLLPLSGAETAKKVLKLFGLVGQYKGEIEKYTKQ